MRLPLNSSQLRVLLFLMGFLILSVGMLITSGGKEESGQKEDSSTSLGMTGDNPSPTPKGYVLSQSDGTIVYGLWNSSVGSQIRMVNSDGTNDFPIATLPPDIKDVHVLSGSTLLYIGGVDALDHGKTIDLYSLTGRRSNQIVKTTEGWFIDDVIVSPDKDYIAWWEVKFAPYQKRLLNGQSRVYLKNINTDETFQVVDELATSDSPIHYPFFFDHKNRLFMDTFIPNQGRAFYLGVEYVNADSPRELHAVAELSRGKFSSEIELSPTDNFAVYTGFDYTARPIIENPYYEIIKRPELDNPNQVVMLDLETFTPTVIANSEEGKRYGNPIFSSDGNFILYDVEHLNIKDGKPETTLDYKIGVYSTEDKTTDFIDYPIRKGLKIIDYKNNQLIYGESTNGQPANLGNKYALGMSKFTTQAISDNKTTVLAQSKKMHFLTYLPRKAKSGQLIALDAAIEPTAQRDPSQQLGELIVPEDKILDPRLDMQNNPVPQENQTKNPDSPTPLPPTLTSPPIVTPTPTQTPQATCAELTAAACINYDFTYYNWLGRKEKWFIDKNKWQYYIFDDSHGYQVYVYAGNDNPDTWIVQETKACYDAIISRIPFPNSVCQNLVNKSPDKIPFRLWTIFGTGNSGLACDTSIPGFSQRCCDTFLKCYDSPLYLYPEKTTKVSVKPVVGDKIYYSNPKLEDREWNITAQPDGTKIDYNYLSKNVPAPVAGLVSSGDNLQMNLSYYGSRLGLVGRELSDFESFWLKELSKLNNPYFFISHYDRETAAKIMSFEITPKVDTFIQVVMYFKPLQYPISVSPPDFEAIPQRHGFTAVDWSGKIEP